MKSPAASCEELDPQGLKPDEIPIDINLLSVASARKTRQNIRLFNTYTTTNPTPKQHR